MVVVLEETVLVADEDLEILGELEVVFDTVGEPVEVFVVKELTVA